MEQHIEGRYKIKNLKEEEILFIWMAKDMKVNLLKEWNTEKENTITLKVSFTLEIGFKIKSMGLDNIFTKMELGIGDSFRTTWSMDTEGSINRMAAIMKVSH